MNRDLREGIGKKVENSRKEIRRNWKEIEELEGDRRN